MGQTAQIIADIRYPTGEEVTQGIYTAAIYPQQLQNQYTQNIYTEFANQQLTTLTYNPTINKWTANITLPSPLDAGPVASLQGAAAYYAGPYDLYISGLSFDGYPTTTDLSAQKAFYLQPYLYIENQTTAVFLQTSGLALNAVTINGTVNLTNNVFLDSNSIQSTVAKISGSTIAGTLNIVNSSVTLIGVRGGSVTASDSNLTLINSDIAALSLINSKVSLSSASYQTISPAVPAIQITSPINGSTNNGDINVNLSVIGNSIDKVTVQLNSLPIATFNENGTLSFTLQSANYHDGNYQMQVVASQTTGISTIETTNFNFNNQANAQQSSINTLNSTVSTLQRQLDSSNSAKSNLQNQINTLNSQLSNVTSALATINSTQPTVLNQLGNLNDTLSSTLNIYESQIEELKDSLDSAETFAVVGFTIGFLGVVLAAVVVWKRTKK
jgi:CII-binding regulator of phage lambda lysogenization HflD